MQALWLCASADVDVTRRTYGRLEELRSELCVCGARREEERAGAWADSGAGPLPMHPPQPRTYSLVHATVIARSRSVCAPSVR